MLSLTTPILTHTVRVYPVSGAAALDRGVGDGGPTLRHGLSPAKTSDWPERCVFEREGVIAWLQGEGRAFGKRSCVANHRRFFWDSICLALIVLAKIQVARTATLRHGALYLGKIAIVAAQRDSPARHPWHICDKIITINHLAL